MGPQVRIELKIGQTGVSIGRVSREGEDSLIEAL